MNTFLVLVGDATEEFARPFYPLVSFVDYGSALEFVKEQEKKTHTDAYGTTPFLFRVEHHTLYSSMDVHNNKPDELSTIERYYRRVLFARTIILYETPYTPEW